MIEYKYVPNIHSGTPETDAVTIRGCIHLNLEEALRIRAALSDVSGEDLDNYGGILERLRTALPL